MSSNDARHRRDRNRIQLYMLLWVMEAGVIARETLRERVLEWLHGKNAWGGLDFSEKKTFNNQFRRDLCTLRDARLIHTLHPDGADAAFQDDARERHVFYRADADLDFVVMSEHGPAPDTTGLQLIPRSVEGQGLQRLHSLQFSLAELHQASGPGGTGHRLIERLSAALCARKGLKPLEATVRYRALPPNLGETGRRPVRLEIWEMLIEAVATRRFVYIHTDRSTQRKRQPTPPTRYFPLRIVWYNGRARVEVCYRRLGIRQYRAIPLRFIQRVEILRDAFEADFKPSKDEQAILNRLWGTDLGEQEPDREDNRALAERQTQVVLRFTGSAADAVFNDPGCREARLIRSSDERGNFVRYEVQTIVGRHFRTWLRGWGGEVQVEAPHWLAHERVTEAHAILAVHGFGSNDNLNLN